MGRVGEGGGGEARATLEGIGDGPSMVPRAAQQDPSARRTLPGKIGAWPIPCAAARRGSVTMKRELATNVRKKGRRKSALTNIAWTSTEEPLQMRATARMHATPRR